MRNIKNVVDFADLCVFAEQENIAGYNPAHDILNEFYPHDGTFELHKIEVDQYTDDPQAIEILTRFIESKKVEFINITQ
jgi:hypothetical protein